MPRVIRADDTASVLMSALETRATEGKGPTWVDSRRPRLQKRSVSATNSGTMHPDNVALWCAVLSFVPAWLVAG